MVVITLTLPFSDTRSPLLLPEKNSGEFQECDSAVFTSGNLLLELVMSRERRSERLSIISVVGWVRPVSFC